MRSSAYDLEFREQSGRIRDWGAGLLLLAALMWGWCAILLLTSKVADDWSEALVVLGLSVPVSVAGTALFTIGMVSRRMSAHGQAMRDLDRLAGEAVRPPTT
ncbi:hypothetical protein AB0936_04455 [Streptomyces cyaneofuscatus]|uniref:hypothetical protein n=1 Tax=Streptomyces cyaneofuscatus TaxID=66883 RepID=UPI0004C7A107|nr:hypothetical protein [Streptomyces cyaneofuscatus]